MERLANTDPCEARYNSVFSSEIEDVQLSYEVFKSFKIVIMKVLERLVDKSVVALFRKLFELLDEILTKHIVSIDKYFVNRYFYVKFGSIYLSYVLFSLLEFLTAIGKSLGMPLIKDIILTVDRMACLMEGFSDSIEVFEQEVADGIIAEFYSDIGECNFEILRDLIIKNREIAHMIAHSPTMDVAFKRAKSIVEYFIANKNIDAEFLEGIR